jgi:hypothetical protein
MIQKWIHCQDGFKHVEGVKNLINPLPLLFKALLHGQKDCFFSADIFYVLNQTFK